MSGGAEGTPTHLQGDSNAHPARHRPFGPHPRHFAAAERTARAFLQSHPGDLHRAGPPRHPLPARPGRPGRRARGAPGEKGAPLPAGAAAHVPRPQPDRRLHHQQTPGRAPVPGVLRPLPVARAGHGQRPRPEPAAAHRGRGPGTQPGDLPLLAGPHRARTHPPAHRRRHLPQPVREPGVLHRQQGRLHLPLRALVPAHARTRPERADRARGRTGGRGPRPGRRGQPWPGRVLPGGADRPRWRHHLCRAPGRRGPAPGRCRP